MDPLDLLSGRRAQAIRDIAGALDGAAQQPAVTPQPAASPAQGQFPMVPRSGGGMMAMGAAALRDWLQRSGGQRMLDRLTGSNGQERVQTFPERMARNIIGLPAAVERSGQFPVGSQESIDALIPGAQALGGLVGGAGAFAAPRGGLGMAGGRPRQPSAPPERPAVDLPADAAARLARADEMGMRMNMPLIIGRAPAGEGIASAAIKVGDRVFEGPSHFDAMLKVEQALGKPFEDIPLGPMPDGFLTTSGRFVSRHEAQDIAGAGQQAAKPQAGDAWAGYEGLTSERLRVPAARPTEAGFDTAATAPGLPGGGGGTWAVWNKSGRDLGPGETAAVHRAAQPTSVDAAGLAASDIHATLQQAWDLGKDSVLLKNYTRPGSKTPENIIVTRDTAQLRDPMAAFDLSRIGSPDLMASLIGGALAAPVIWGSLGGGRQP